MLVIKQIVPIIQATLVQQTQSDQAVYHLLLDSRKLYNPSQALYFAINGEHHNGHEFVAELYARGVRNFVIEENLPAHVKLPNANILKVTSAVNALQQVAAAHRNQYQIPVIGVTGSNGKTMVKEWLAKLLAEDFKVVKSPKSYNSQTGVPLSVWQMNKRHTMGIFEAGISAKNEMTALQKVIQPSIGIFTNLGTAHDEGFDNRTQKFAEKWKLFEHCKAVVCCAEHLQTYHDIVTKTSFSGQPFTWGKNEQAQLRLLDKQTHLTQQQTQLKVQYQGENHFIQAPFIDEASVENILHCVATMCLLGLSFDKIQRRIARLRPVSMRLELKRGMRNTYLIDDSYNNDLAGLKIALDFMSTQDVNLQKIVVLSDMLQSGLPPEKLYQAIAQLLQSKAIDRVIAVGEEIKKHQASFNVLDVVFFDQTKDLLESQVELARLANAVILVKGARRFRFEHLVHQLQQKVHGTVLEINLGALVHNLNFYREQLPSHTKMMVMVKAFAYGSGSAEIAHLLQFHRVDYLGVAYADEGVFLRESGIDLPIMVMNPSEDTFDKLLQYDLEPEMYSFKVLDEFIHFLKEQQTTAKVHLKIDTGMHRLGFVVEEVPRLLQVLQQPDTQQKAPLDYLSIASVFSHLAGSDEATHNAYSQQQITLFEAATKQIETALGYEVIKHILNSPGIVRFPEASFDMVRLGIGLYGIEANQIAQSQLQSISRLTTTISQIKYLQPGETVGYSRKGVASHTTKTATVAIGYADGFSRAFSNGVGKVMVNGAKVPVIGNVCMDMCMIDVTGVEATEGDEVIIFNEELSILDLAQSIDTIPYEILTNISQRVKRVFYLE
ncbi:bifunctional UDP-N-acetylmuramoyl-tripeptide:D-alanyl-D-alanine ligase/alanine racemase [Microscilla marina]|uniref:Alanine racemase n=1 Tax=Microscilla marina ATCC 23134 TaxID=313606 RepID=A1ZJI0_MICM2|nr:bifunctional UDP-N-acetylmuramoyl-tripeptide:D-alanyl-D-alanine ligase/alanine racemase [Microscilla marina]EAY29283.1 Mur ligase domain protein/alanine racemase [Microscilla marina ATCC 23134]